MSTPPDRTAGGKVPSAQSATCTLTGRDPGLVSALAGWVSVGVDHDTTEFAVHTLRRWWRQMGRHTYPDATRLLITADGGGSNSSRSRRTRALVGEAPASKAAPT